MNGLVVDQIKNLVTAREAAEHYGFFPNRAGYICCPFHGEKTASLKLYDGQRGWHCFGCGAGGSVIDFVMRLFDIPFQQAILRINSDFSLGLSLDKPDPASQTAVREARRRDAQRKAELARMEDQYRELAAEHRFWLDALKYFPPTDGDGGYIHPLYAEAAKKQPYIAYLLDDLEEKIAEVNGRGGRKGSTVRERGAGTPGQTA